MHSSTSLRDALLTIGGLTAALVLVELAVPSLSPGERPRCSTAWPWPRSRSPAHPGTAIIVLSQHVDTAGAVDLLADRADGIGYLLSGG